MNNVCDSGGRDADRIMVPETQHKSYVMRKLACYQTARVSTKVYICVT